MSNERPKPWTSSRLFPKEEFLQLFSETLCVTTTCKDLGFDPRTAYYNRQRDPQFAAAWEEILNTWRVEKGEDLEQKVMDRAINGWLEPVYQGGQMIGSRRRFSNALSIFMMKALMPALYHLEKIQVQSGDAQLRAMLESYAQMKASMDQDGDSDHDTDEE